MPIQFGLKRLSLAGKLTSLHLKDPKNLKLIPYVQGEVDLFFSRRIGIGENGRQGTAGLENDLNPTFAVDGKSGIGQQARLIGYYAHSLFNLLKPKVSYPSVAHSYTSNGIPFPFHIDVVKEIGVSHEFVFLKRSNVEVLMPLVFGR